MSKCLPQIVAESFGKPIEVGDKTSEIAGPNCFNLAIYSAGLAPALVHSTDEELGGLIRPPFCEAVSGGKPSAGDIGVMSKEGEAIHAFTYISPQLAWTKNGANAASVNQFDSFKRMTAVYEYPFGGECSERKGQKRTAEGCQSCFAPVTTTYYRCRPIEDVLRSSHGELSSSLLSMNDEVRRLSCSVSTLFFNKGALSIEAATSLNQAVFALAKFYANEVKSEPIALPPSSKRDVLLSMLRVHLLSLEYNLESLRDQAGDKSSTNLQSQVGLLLGRWKVK